MKHILTLLFCVMFGLMNAQSVEWNFHPLNMDPCQTWINPNGCGGCSSCSESFDSDASILQGSYVSWNAIDICPHPLAVGSTENILNTTGWLDSTAYFSVTANHFANMQIDSLIVIAGRFPGSCNQVTVDVMMDGNTTQVAQATIVGILDTTVVTNLGCTGSFGSMTVTLRGGGPLNVTGQMFIKGVRIVASECLSTQVAETPANALYRVVEGGIYIDGPAQDVRVVDASGRTKLIGLHQGFIPIDGMSIVRIGNTTSKIIP